MKGINTRLAHIANTDELIMYSTKNSAKHFS